MELYKDKAVSYLQMIIAGQIDEAYEKHTSPEMRHHNPYFPGDRESLKQAMKENDGMGNFHVNENGLVFFDFDDCAYHFYAQDLAVSIYHALWTGTSFNFEWADLPVEFLTAFLEGYSTGRPLTFEMYDQLLVCLQMREIYLYSLFVLRWNADEMLDWQVGKLKQLKGNIEARVVPYKYELEKVKHLFQV